MPHGHGGGGFSHGHHGGGGFSHGRDGGGQFGQRHGGGGVGRDSGGSFPNHHGPSHRPVVHHPHHHIFPSRPMIVPVVTTGPMYTRGTPDVAASVFRWVCLLFTWLVIAVVCIVTFNSLRQAYGQSSGVWTVKSNTTMPIEVTSFFTKEIQVKGLMSSSGPILYTFSEKPALSRSADYSVNLNSSIGPNSYWQWTFWLNKGSELKISYSVPSSGLILAIPSGRNGLEDWKDNPRDSETAKFWSWLAGTGETSFVVPSDDIYYIGLGNLNPYKTKALVDVKIHSLLYETTNADTVCEVFGRVCVAKIPFLGSTHVVLETPSQGTVPDWDVEIIHKGRWALLWVVIGCIAAVALCRVWCSVSGENGPPSESSAPAQMDTASGTAPPSSVPPSAPPLDSSVLAEGSEREPLIKNKDDEQEEETVQPEGNLCAVCFENPKDSFMDPCGHRSTCYNCGVSIQKGASPKCPICREQIRAVRKIYDV